MTYTDRPNKPYRSRTWLYSCPICFKWQPILSLQMQSICKEAGSCPTCIRDDFYMLRIRIIAIEQRLVEIMAIGKALPEGKRGTMREIYARKARQLVDARAHLEQLYKSQEVPV